MERKARRPAWQGYACFALDLARGDADIRGAVSFHGLLNPSRFTEPEVRAKVLMLHGYDGPMAAPDEVLLAHARRVPGRSPQMTGVCGCAVLAWPPASL